MKNIFLAIVIAGWLVSGALTVSAQGTARDSVKFDYQKIFAFCLDADIRSAMLLLDTDGTKKISVKNLAIKKGFDDRFKYNEDRSRYLSERKSTVDSLFFIYHHYWRTALLDTATNYDASLVSNLGNFFKRYYFGGSPHSFNEDSLDTYLKKYIGSHNLHTTGFGKTGRLYDLLVWRTEKDTVYSFKLGQEDLKPRVVFMDSFITLGWEEYATLDKLYPGGWTTPEALFCVRKAYDLNSESFLISYLAHEGRHFADTKLFPKLSSPDLEYRAKLVELSLADKTLHSLIEFFINNANHDSKNGHSVANYCVIRDLSRVLFHVDFEQDKSKWNKIGNKEINAAAAGLLEKNTSILLGKGKKVKSYIVNGQ